MMPKSYQYTVLFYRDGVWGSTELTRSVRFALKMMEQIKEQFERGLVDSIKLARRERNSDNQEWETMIYFG